MLERSQRHRPPDPIARDRRREQRRERQRRYRERQAAARVWVASEFSAEEIDKLHRLEYLALADLENPDRVADALHALLAKLEDV
jgi:hypothetical protein